MALTCQSGQTFVTIVRKNSACLTIHLKTDGLPIQNLASALSARFVAVDSDGDVVIDKDMTSGVTLDDPEVGDVKVELNSIDTDIEYGRYDIAFQVVWGASDQLEWNFTSPLLIQEEIIP